MKFRENFSNARSILGGSLREQILKFCTNICSFFIKSSYGIYIWWVKIHELKNKLEQRRCWCYDLNNTRDYVHTRSSNKIVIVWASV